MITREGHPFEGRALAVIGSIRRRGVLFALACLPDGSRALIPAQWTDWDEGHCGSVRACRGTAAPATVLIAAQSPVVERNLGRARDHLARTSPTQA